MIARLALFLMVSILVCSIGFLLYQLFILISSSLNFCPPSYVKNKITFKAFKSFYEVKPSRWCLEDTYVVYHKHTGPAKFKFSLIDTFRYKRFLKNKDEIEERIQINKEYSEMIECVRADIADLEEQSMSEMQTAVASIKDITSRM